MAAEQKKRKTDRSKHSHQAQLCVKVDAYDIDHLMLRAPVNQFGLVVMAQSLRCDRSAGCRFESVLQFTFLQNLQHTNTA